MDQMDNLKLGLSHQTQTGSNKYFQEKYLIKRIDEHDIEISVDERNEILKALNDGQRFIQVKKYTLMLNSIKSIDPKYGERNIPPKPSPIYIGGTVGEDGIVHQKLANGEEIEEWIKLFGNKYLE